MATAKKTKRKSRTKQLLELEELASAEVFAEFCQTVEKESVFRGARADGLELRHLLWGVPDDVIQATQLARELSANRKLKLSTVPEAPEVSRTYSIPGLDSALTLLVSMESFARHPGRFEPRQVSESLQALADVVFQEDVDLLINDPVVHQLLYVEIPWSLGLQLSRLSPAAEMLSEARKNLVQALDELLDGDGMPPAQYLGQTGMLAACWTRCRSRCRQADAEFLDIDARTQYEYFIRQMMRLIRRDGTQVFSEDGVDLRPVVSSALTFIEDEEDLGIAAVLFSKQGKNGTRTSGKKRKTPRVSLNALPESTSYSEWAELACLRSEWYPDSPRLTVSFGERQVLAELATDEVLFSGEIRCRFQVNDEPVSVTSDWEVVCWHSDQDGDFLELECELEQGAKWQKHFLLARNEEFLLLGDVILGAGDGLFQLESSWPLGQSAGFGRAQETRELFLTQNAKTSAAVLPLSAPEWRCQKSDTSLEVSERKLVLTGAGYQGNFYWPVFVDLNPKRCRQPLTWRQLTVAEDLEIVPKSVAAAFRVQVGGQQWVLYRSLAGIANRTFLGQHLNVEYYAGAMEEDGTSSEIISVS